MTRACSPLLFAAAFAAITAVSACGTDGGGGGTGSDAGAGMTGTDAAVVQPDGAAADVCVGAADGLACETDGVCLAGVCAASRCGDKVIDVRAGEQCEDNNEMSGDGCTLCRFDCVASAGCDDGVACNGAEFCDTGKHMCTPGTAVVDNTACSLDPVTMGMCRKGVCQKAGCGNGATDAGEECDDADDDDADGCTSACKFTCKVAADCDNGNACDGAETCAVATHTCAAGQAVVCQANGCAGQCNPRDGMCAFPDVDKDGSSCNLDCNDVDPVMFPGGFECKDGKDNDCSAASTDGTAPGCECYVDSDKDGFAASVTGAIASPGACLAGYTRTKPVDMTTTDCGARNASAHPGQTDYFPTGYCPGALVCTVGAQRSFDYNCDGGESSALLDNKKAAATCVGATTEFNCTFRSGWVGDVIPACGGKATYRTCTYTRTGCTGVDTPDRARPCR